MIEVEVRNGQGIIDILSDDFASCLIIKRALSVNWPDCRGSVGEYYSISNYSIKDRNEYTNQLNEFLISGDENDQLKCIETFLNLFSNGNYRIHKNIIDHNNSYFLKESQVEYGMNVPENEKFFGWFFPSYDDLREPRLYTITNDKLDRERIDFYVDLISKGERPTIIAFQVCNILTSEYSCSYILDGHHKIEAYQKLNIPIPTIFILKIEECIHKTQNLLNSVRPILKDFEYEHLFENNDENILNVSFVNDQKLTLDLDNILKTSSVIEPSIIRVLQKYFNSINEDDRRWAKKRLNVLKRNVYIDVFNLKTLTVYKQKEIIMYEKPVISWFLVKITNRFQLSTWIRNTVKNS